MTNQKNQGEKVTGLIIFLNRYYRLIIIILSLLIIVLGFFLWLKPKYQEMKKLTALQLPLREEKLKELSNYAEELEKLAKNLTDFQTQYQEELQKLEKILPRKADLAGLFAQLEALITANGFELNSVSFTEGSSLKSTSQSDNLPQAATSDSLLSDSWLQSESSGDGLIPPAIAQQKEAITSNQPTIKTIEIGLEIQGGGYLAFKTLLENIERHLRVMDVSSINFNDIYINETASEKANYSLNLKTYYLP